MTESEKSEYVNRMVNSHDKAPINYYIRRSGPRSAQAQLPHHVQVECSELVTVATHPWDRLPEETSKQYQAFTVYRDLGPDRSRTEVARTVNMSAHGSLTGWMRIHKWVARVRAYDEWFEKAARRVVERKKREMVESHAALGAKMVGIAQQSLDSGIVLPETVADVVRLATAGTQIERLSRDLSTSNVAVTGSMKLVLAHPLPPWAPEGAKDLVEEDVFTEENEMEAGNVDSGN